MVFRIKLILIRQSQPTTWLDAYDLPKHCEGTGPDDVLFVDVAGGVGHQCALLKGKLPELKGRVILEDLPMVIPHAIPTPGVENMGIDMWQGQPIKGSFSNSLEDDFFQLTK